MKTLGYYSALILGGAIWVILLILVIINILGVNSVEFRYVNI